VNFSVQAALAIWLAAGALFFAKAMGDEPPKFHTADEEMVDPFEDHKAKAIVLVFVRTDCPISNRYATELQRLHAKFAMQTVWWLIYPDGDVTTKAIRKHKKDYKLEIPALSDPGHALVNLAGAHVTPEAAVFLPGKKRVYRGRIDDRFLAFGKYRSEATRHDLEEALTDLVNDQPVRVPETKAIGCTISSGP
jgi:peroxiredoxin